MPASDLPRDVHVLSAVAFLVAVGFGVMVPVLPVFARSFGVNQFAVGAVISTFALMRFLTSPLCGPINRLIGERVALGAGIGIVALSTAGAGLAQTYPQLLVLRGVGGIGSAMFSVSAMVLLLASVTAAQRGRASALYSGGFLLGGMAGPAIGGGLAAISIRAPFFFYAFTLVLAGGVGLAMLSKRTVRPDEHGEHGEHLEMSLREAWQQSRYRVACWANFASGWQAQGARSTLVPLLVVEVLNREAAWTGISFAIAAVVQAIALQPAGRLTDTWGRKPVLVVGLIASGLSSAFIPTASTELAAQHYEEHVGRPYYSGLVEFVTSGPLVAMVLAGERVIEAVRLLNGSTDSAAAAPGTIRGDLSLSNSRNLVHASDSPATAAREIDLWFPGLR